MTSARAELTAVARPLENLDGVVRTGKALHPTGFDNAAAARVRRVPGGDSISVARPLEENALPVDAHRTRHQAPSAGPDEGATFPDRSVRLAFSR